MRPRTLLAITLLALAAPGGCKKLDDSAVSADEEEPKPKKKKKHTDEAWTQGGPIPVKSTDPQIGSRTALVTIVVFSDLQCPFCKRLDDTFATLRTKYGDKLRVVWHDFPLDFHKEAQATAEAAQMVFLAKGSEAHAKFVRKAFANQTSLTDESREKWMSELGVDEVTADLRRRAKERVLADIELGKKLGVTGTPHSFVDGHSVPGAEPDTKFTSLIDAHLEAAAELTVAPDKVYEKLCEKFFTAKKPVSAAEDDETIYKVGLVGAPLEGPKDALVTIVTFGDYQCPFCKRLDDVLVLLRKDYPTKLRLAFRHEPLAFHKRAVPVAHFAIEAFVQKGASKFFDVHHALFASQPRLDDADLEAIAKANGLDVPKVMAAVATNKWTTELARDHTMATLLSVTGTPCSFVNGRKVVGAQPYPKIKSVVEERLAEAEKLVKDGVAPDKVYDEIMKTAK